MVARSSIFVGTPSIFGPFISYWQLDLYCYSIITHGLHIIMILIFFLQSKLISRDNDELTMTFSPVGLIGLMLRTLCQVIAKVRIWFPVKPEFFQVHCQPLSLFIQLRGSYSLSYLYPQLKDDSFHIFQFDEVTIVLAYEYQYTLNVRSRGNWH